METIKQVMAALYVALGEAAGGPAAMRTANRVLRDAIEDRAIDDPLAIEILRIAFTRRRRRARNSARAPRVSAMVPHSGDVA